MFYVILVFSFNHTATVSKELLIDGIITLLVDIANTFQRI